MSEKDIQDAIYEALSYNAVHKTYIWRNNTGVARYDAPGGGSRFVRFGKVGAGDLIGTCYGRHIEIETKCPGKKQTPKQKEHENRIRSTGGIYLLATSLEEALSKYWYEIRFMKKIGWIQMMEEFFNEMD